MATKISGVTVNDSIADNQCVPLSAITSHKWTVVTGDNLTITTTETEKKLPSTVEMTQFKIQHEDGTIETITTNSSEIAIPLTSQILEIYPNPNVMYVCETCSFVYKDEIFS